jgi:hypothetical protein
VPNRDPSGWGQRIPVSVSFPFYKEASRETQRKACATEEVHVPGSTLPRPRTAEEPTSPRAPRQDLPPIPPGPPLLRGLRLPPSRERRAHAARPGIPPAPTKPSHGSRDWPDEAEPRPQQEAGGGGGGHGARCGRGGAGAAAATAGGVRGAAGVPQGQRVHPRALPRRVARPRRAPQRLRLAQRDAQRLDVRAPLPRPSPPCPVRPSEWWLIRSFLVFFWSLSTQASGRVPVLPSARGRRRTEGGRRRCRSGYHEVHARASACRRFCTS